MAWNPRPRPPSSWVWARIGRKAHASNSAIYALCGREFKTTLYPTDLPRCAVCEAEVARQANPNYTENQRCLL